MKRLLEKYKDIEASENKTNNRNDKLDILIQILLSDHLLENLKNSDEQLLSFFSEEKIFTEVFRFCLGFNSDFMFSTELLQNFQYQNQVEIRKALSLKCLQVFLNIPLSSCSDLISSSLEFSDICSDLFLLNIKYKIMKICIELFQNNSDDNNDLKCADTHFFGFFSQIILKIMKWSFPIFFMPDIYKQKITERNENNNTDNKIITQIQKKDKKSNDQLKIQIKKNDNILEKIENLNKIIDYFGLNLKIDAIVDHENLECFISISQNNLDSFIPNYKYISNLIIFNIHDNYAMQEFLVDILKFYPEALPDGSIIKRLSQIACNDFDIKNINSNNIDRNCSNCIDNCKNNEKLDTVKISFKDNEDNTQKDNINIDDTKEIDFDYYFNKLKNCFCDSLDACYTIVDIYHSLSNESPIFYQFQDSTVLNNIMKAASIIYDEEKDKPNNSFKHTVLTMNLIDIVTKTVATNNKLLSSVDLPSNLIISQENVSDVTVSMMELYLKKKALMKENSSKSSNPPRSNLPFYRRMSPSYHSFNPNLNNLTMFQLQSRNCYNDNDTKYKDECELFKLFFTSEKLQIKLVNYFFNNDEDKQNSIGNKSLIQSSSTNCINKFDSPTSSSTSLRYSANIDCSYPRSQSTGTWQQNEKSLSNDEISLLTTIANIPGLVTNLERAYDKDPANRLKVTRSKSSNVSTSNNSSNLNLSNNNTSTAISYDTFVSTNSSNEVYSSTESSCESIDDLNSSPPPRWTPACKFLALSLAKLNLNSNIVIPIFNSRKWKSSILPAIRKFGLILESTYGFGEPISRHRSCSMNDKLPNISQPFSSNTTNNSSFSKSIELPIFPINQSNTHSCIEKRRNSLEKVKFSSNFFPSSFNSSNHYLSDDDDIELPSIKIDQDNDYNDNRMENENDECCSDLASFEPEELEIDVNENDFENQCEKENKIDRNKLKTCKNHPHSMNKLFSTPRPNQFGFCGPPTFLNETKSNSESYSSSDSVNNIKMPTQQTLIEKNKNTQQTPPSPKISSSNSEGDDEFIIDI